MATVPKSDRTTIVTLASAIAGPFDLTFRLFDDDKLSVYVNDLPRTDFTITSSYVYGYDDNATITFDAALESGDVIRIHGDLVPNRGSDYLDGPNLTSLLNVELARIWSSLSEMKRDTNRSFKVFQSVSPIAIVPKQAIIGNEAGDGFEFGAPGGEVTPLQFGVNTTPGTTDMTTAIQQAIDYAAANGGRVTIPAGVYLVSSPLRIRTDGVSIIGMGKETTEIRSNSATGYTLNISGDDPFNGDTVRRVDVQGIKFVNTAANPSAGGHILMDRATQVTVMGCSLFNHYRGAVFAGCDESCKLIDVEITQGANVSAVQSGSAGVAILRRNVASTTGSPYLDATDGLYYIESNSVYISDFNIRSNETGGASGMEFNFLTGACDGVYICNGHAGFASNAVFGFCPEQSNISLANILVSNVFIDPKFTVTNYGVRVYDRNTVGTSVMDQIEFNGCTLGGPVVHGVSLEMKMNGFRFIGGKIVRCGQSGVSVNHADVRDVKVALADIVSCNTGGGTSPSVNVISGRRIQIKDNNIITGFRGVQVSTGAQQVNVDGNIFSGMTDGRSIFLLNGASDTNSFGDNTLVEALSIASETNVTIPQGDDAFEITGAVNINNFLTSSPTSYSYRRRFSTRFTGALTLSHNAGGTGNLRLNGSANLITTAGTIVSWECWGGVFYEVARSVA